MLQPFSNKREVMVQLSWAKQHSAEPAESEIRRDLNLLSPFRKAGTTMRSDCVVTSGIALIVAVRGDPQILEGKLGPLANHAVRVGINQRIGRSHQLICHRLACTKIGTAISSIGT